ncbi:cobaltochelatase subunit CobN [Paracoccus spongiarum]|uniref:Cobaltochelatase subunit CobN n=1 Tax=Paracoccus spongiarum TaxID=3064387 RepID=A0ABT9JB63_9RHOB|nr:cobaltochelatase subunit CobN [Paracoccus sp. 2205BS29-5]MDP5306934.1 cobaltochelatase subunit CobN [Paracoccus sp. 2205BS29-5]
MHVVFRESHGLDRTDTPHDPGQTPADLVALSFSDSDLGAFAAGWKRAAGGLPPLRLCNLVALRHPVSVDTYAEATLAGAKAILIRLIGGEAYWPYGLASVQDLARRRGIALAVLPGDGRDDPRLDEVSTLPAATLRALRRLCDAGGPAAAQAALAMMARAAGLPAGPVSGRTTLPETGFYDPRAGVIGAVPGDGPLALVSFYRSYLAAADTGPVDALLGALRQAGFAACGVFAPSLKAPGLAGWLAASLPRAPAVIVNATGFSARDEVGRTPFDGFDCPVFQIALSTNRRRDWLAAERGLSPSDLAMHVVLPEVDGRIFAGVVSFKAPAPRDPDLQFSRFAHRADPGRIAAATARIAGWHRLATTPPADRRLALVLSSYPGRDWQMAHAVGLDALTSAEAVARMLAEAGYHVPPGAGAPALRDARIVWPLADYLAALDGLPAGLRDDLAAAWGPPDNDPDLIDGGFRFAAIRRGNLLLALQPERGHRATRADEYHDLTRVPRHAYVAFHLWLQSQGLHAMIHMGAHGTLEWLPGKAVALSQGCWPEALTGALPVIYPFIVNDPGEAAQARRRLGAVTLGHLPPPMVEAQTPPALAHLERLLDEYSTADGLDPARRDRLVGAIRDEARAAGVEDDLGIPAAASAAEAITRIDRFVCDIKESQFGEGLHVWGSGACAAEERAGLMRALAGLHVAPGPSGSPARGRQDILPTGRNLFAVDPRAVPTPAAHAQGVRLAEELLRRHLQDHGDWPRGLVVDLWGSATMRTGGEDFAMALHLAGLMPVWDAGSGRVSGVEVVVPALLGRPRIDVTLRVSGLFRDVFPVLAQLFETGAEALADRDEDPAENPYRARAPRVYAPAPGQYGLGMGIAAETFTDAARAAAGEAWLAASGWAIGRDGTLRPDRAGLETRLAGADSFVHAQDLAESDLLLAADYAAHEAGFAAAMARIGAPAPVLYHLDTTQPDRPRARSLTEEIARTLRARAADPRWAGAMMRHGARGAAEIAATLDHLAAFAHLARAVPPHLFDLYHDATLGRPEIAAFMARENPAALAAMRDLFGRLAEAGLWVTRRNSIAAGLEAAP